MPEITRFNGIVIKMFTRGVKMLSIKVVEVVPIDDMELLVFFENGCTKKFDVKNLIKDNPEFEELKDRTLFNTVKVEPGGYGVSWNRVLDCSEGELYTEGVEVDVHLNDFYQFAKNNLINTKEAAEMIGCSKQNIDDLVRRKKLHPVKKGTKYSLFLKTEVLRRMW